MNAMKVAVCFSGLCPPDIDLSACMERTNHAFGDYDFFFGTWSDRPTSIKSFQDVLPNQPLMTVPEPTIPYHPIDDIDTSLIQDRALRAAIIKKQGLKNNRPRLRDLKMQQGTKQIIAHAKILDRVPSDYNMVIRMRYDNLISTEIDFAPLLEQSFQANQAIGFASGIGGGLGIKPPFYFNKLTEVTPKLPSYYLPDCMIMHPRSIFNTKRVYNLHEQKQLLPFELGWSQVMGNNRGIVGGVQIYRIWKEHSVNPQPNKFY